MDRGVVISYPEHINGAYVAAGFFLGLIPIVVSLALVGIWRSGPTVAGISRNKLIGAFGVAFLFVFIAIYHSMFFSTFFEVRIYPDRDRIELLLLFPERLVALYGPHIRGVELVPDTDGIGEVLRIQTVSDRSYYSPDVGPHQLSRLLDVLGAFDKRHE